VTDFLHGESIEFIEKVKNPPNFPQARGIEKFWALCKQKYRALKKQSMTLVGFRRVWERVSEEVGRKHGKAVMDHAKKNLLTKDCEGIKALVK
jgi:hypothetical protein